MKTASLHEIKKELQELSPARLSELCLAVAKYKKDNKEFLGYLLFESHNKPAFLQEIKLEIDGLFNELKPGIHLYYAKKSLRKILRTINKYSRYMGDKAMSAELSIYFCTKLKDSGMPLKKSQLISNMYDQQIKKINALVSALHEDLQADFLIELEALTRS
jgi:hypothetical protein